ncbi:MAG: HEPN domain-containing protein, partial [Cyanobacteria bacterium MAG CAR4_bin_6]|nr:HEPN domain-containing protein [Cyanobacteria bacterium MAG CAR4_bin_6]
IPDYLKSSLAHYICILISSYLENSLRQIILDYAERKCSDQSICKFVNSSLGRMRNPNYQNIKDLLEKFDLRIRLENRQREAIKSVYINRNGIVHSESPKGLSLLIVKEYFETICTVVDAIDKVFSV